MRVGNEVRVEEGFTKRTGRKPITPHSTDMPRTFSVLKKRL